MPPTTIFPDSKFATTSAPRGLAGIHPGLPWRLAAYEALQEIHRSSRAITLYAAEPAELADWSNLPRLKIEPIGMQTIKAPAFGESAPEANGGLPERKVLWWEEGTPEEALAGFGGDVLLAASAEAAERPETQSWGFAAEGEDSPVLNLIYPSLFLERAWSAGASENVRSRLGPMIARSNDSVEAVALANYARMLGNVPLQLAGLKRAIGLDRNNTTALLSFAAMCLNNGDILPVSVLLEESARVEDLPEKVDELRRELGAKPEVANEMNFYWNAIGRANVPTTALPRRILIVTNLLPPQELGGYGRKIWEFANGLRARGHQVLILTSDQPSLAKTPTADELAMESRVRRTLPLIGEWKGATPHLLSDLSEISRRMEVVEATISAAIRDFRPDAMLVGNLDLLDAVPIRAALEAGIPVLHSLGNQQPGYAKVSQPRSARYCVGAASDWLGQALRNEGYNPARVETIYPGARIDRFFRFFLPDTSQLRICYAGLVVPYKGPQVLVEALVRLHRAGLSFTAEIAGDAPDPEFLENLKATVSDAGMEDKVRFTGFLDRKELSALFARNNVLVFPSQFAEPFGISQVEAMAAGLVVVSSGTGGAKEVIRHGMDGLLFSADSAHDLSQQLNLLAQDPAMMARLQLGAQSRSVEFSVQRSVLKIENLLEELLAIPANWDHVPSQN